MARSLLVVCALCVAFSCAALAQESGGLPSTVHVKLATADIKAKGDVFGAALFPCQEGDLLTVIGEERSFYKVQPTVQRITNMDKYVAGEAPEYKPITVKASGTGHFIAKSSVTADGKAMKLQLQQSPDKCGQGGAAGTAMARGFNEETEAQYISEGGPEVAKAFEEVNRIEDFRPKDGDRRLMKFVRDGRLNTN